MGQDGVWGENQTNSALSSRLFAEEGVGEIWFWSLMVRDEIPPWPPSSKGRDVTGEYQRYGVSSWGRGVLSPLFSKEGVWGRFNKPGKNPRPC